MSAPPQSRILQAIELLKSFDRRGAAALLRQELAAGPPSGDRWRSFNMLAAKIGEIESALEAARRYAATTPATLERLLFYWGELSTYGRNRQALKEAKQLPEQARSHPAILHFLGTLAGQDGDFDQATALYRRALAANPNLPQTWFALAMIRTFAPGDPDIAEMERLRPVMAQAEASIYARFLYGLAKAYQDCGDDERAFSLYSEAAELRRREEKFDADALTAFVDRLIRDFTPEAIRALTPSTCDSDRAIFVTGLPRSGTTLIEQILTSHSEVVDGGEVGLLRPAMLAAGDFSYPAALAYQGRAQLKDPWGELARDYLDMLTARFGAEGRIVDKTLVHSHFMGLLLHVLPHAKVLWIRRKPEDSALSTFRTFFTSPLPWSWSLEDIGRFYREEDRLFAHWTALFPDRILTVRYEELVSDPEPGIGAILAHVGLAPEPQVFEPHKAKRVVRTASVQQVRAPISTKRIDAAKPYERHMEAFQRAYRG